MFHIIRPKIKKAGKSSGAKDFIRCFCVQGCSFRQKYLFRTVNMDDSNLTEATAVSIGLVVHYIAYYFPVIAHTMYIDAFLRFQQIEIN